jgi:transcriptional regulator EpsA
VEDLERFQYMLTSSVKLRTHLEVLVWLQGDMQRYLPHDIMIAAWGDFKTGAIQHDLISIVQGVRSATLNDSIIKPLCTQLFTQWLERDKKAFVASGASFEVLLGDIDKNHALGDALHAMYCALVHGIKDARGSHDCLYLVLSARSLLTTSACTTLTQVLPYIDHALRQVEHLPHQSGVADAGAESGPLHAAALSRQEVDILQWIALGKTNYEISRILGFSVFTIKNSVQRIFRKLNVSNRAQAVAMLSHNAKSTA